MAFKKYNTIADYEADPLPLEESRVSLIMKDNNGNTIDEIKYDSVGRTTEQPLVGDVCCLDENNNIKFLVGGNSLSGTLPQGWTLIGFVFSRTGNKIDIVNKTYLAKIFLGFAQYAWTDVVLTGVQTTKTIGIRCALNWNANTSITCTYTATTLAEAATAMQSAIEDGLNAAGATAAEIAMWHCYADSDNNCVIVQRDACGNNEFYNCSGLTNITWGNMPASGVYLKITNIVTQYQGALNHKKVASYRSTNGRTPNANIVVGGEAGGVAPVNESAFNTNTHCAAIKEYYGTYLNYIKGEFSIKYPQKYGVFNLPSGAELTKTYGPQVAPKKGGGTIVKYPAHNYCYNITYGVTGLDVGDWHMMDCKEAVKYYEEETQNKVQASAAKLNTQPININGHALLANRFNNNNCYEYHGSYGSLTSTGVISSFYVDAVCTLDLTQINQSNNS